MMLWICDYVVTVLVGRTEPNLDDLGLAFDELQISLSELRDFVENVDSKPFPHDVIEFPVAKPNCVQPVEHDHQAVESTEAVGPSASQTDVEGLLNFFRPVSPTGNQQPIPGRQSAINDSLATKPNPD